MYDDSLSDSTLLELHAELKPIFAKHGVPKMTIPSHASLPQIRKGFAFTNRRLNTSPLARRALDCSDPGDSVQRPWSEEDIAIRVRDSTEIQVRIHKPKTIPKTGLPVVVLMHGGGWIMGDANTDALLARLFCVKLNMVVVNVGFRNYPDVRFGIPILDCFDAVKWTAANIKQYGGSCERGFILAGVSGGGAYASIVAHMARDEGLTPKVTGQWLSCPVLSAETRRGENGEPEEKFDTKTVNRSIEQNKDAPLMNKAMQDSIKKFADFEFDSKLLTPFLFKSHENLGSGGVYIQVTGLDPWRDGGRIYQGLCQRGGNRTKMDVYPGLPHCWWTSFPMLKVSSQWIEDCVRGMAWLLEDEKDLKQTTSRL